MSEELPLAPGRGEDLRRPARPRASRRPRFPRPGGIKGARVAAGLHLAERHVSAHVERLLAGAPRRMIDLASCPRADLDCEQWAALQRAFGAGVSVIPGVRTRPRRPWRAPCHSRRRARRASEPWRRQSAACRHGLQPDDVPGASDMSDERFEGLHASPRCKFADIERAL